MYVSVVVVFDLIVGERQSQRDVSYFLYLFDRQGAIKNPVG